MDCDCTMIECLYDFAPGRCACARFAVGVQKVCIVSALLLQLVCIKCAYYLILVSPMHRSIPSWWREAGESGTKQLYQLEKPVVHIVPITSILGLLPLIPAGDHGTIPAALRGSKRDLFLLEKYDEDLQPGTGSKLFYISSWAMWHVLAH